MNNSDAIEIDENEQPDQLDQEQNKRVWKKGTTKIYDALGYSYCKKSQTKKNIFYPCSTTKSTHCVAKMIENIESKSLRMEGKHTCRNIIVDEVIQPVDFTDQIKEHTIDLSINTVLTPDKIWDTVNANARDSNPGRGAYLGLIKVIKSNFENFLIVN